MRQKWFSVLGDEPEQTEEEQDSIKVSHRTEGAPGTCITNQSYFLGHIFFFTCPNELNFFMWPSTYRKT